MPEVRFNCKCIRECVALGIPQGLVLGGTARIDENGYTTFAVDLCCGAFTCNQEIFANYFKIIE